MAIAAITANSFAQEHNEKKEKSADVPAVVSNAFAKQYAGVTPKWEKEDGNYEAEFKLNGVETSVVYTAAGELKETEVEIKPSELPAAVNAYIAKNHAGASVKEAAKITDAAGVVTYEAEVKDRDLIFDAKGNLIK